MDKTVWAVSYISEDNRPTITIFDNETNATLCAMYFNSKGYVGVEIDHAPIYSKFIWNEKHEEGSAVPIKESVSKETREYVKVYCCGDCIYYNWKKHCCKCGAYEEGKPTDNFFRDCPLGLHEECERDKDANSF